YQALAKLEETVKDLDYRTDGVVISVRNLNDRERLGHHSNNPIRPPIGRIAWKFKEEAADVVIKSIECNCGRTGVIKPIVCFDPVSLSDTMVRNATGHNLGYMLRNKITIGTK